MLKKVSLLICCCISISQAYATNYYCDPIKGNMRNKGNQSAPWSSLDSVFITKKAVLPGDTIFLRNGYHGFPKVQGNINAQEYIVIVPEKNQHPTVKKIEIANAERWKIIGLKVSPELIKSYEKGDFVGIKSSAKFIEIDRFIISSTDSAVNNWSVNEIQNKLGIGIRIEGSDCTISNTQITQVQFGIVVSKPAVRSNINHNIIYGFANDGIRGLSNNSRFEYNTISGSYSVDDNHDDAFQSWSTDDAGKVGAGKIENVVFSHNFVISQLDPAQPFKQITGMQGVGNFDGFFENWLVDGNVIITDMWHGIAFYGAINCKIINNVIVKNPLNILPQTPWIAIYNHKKLGPSSENEISNNFTSTIGEKKGVAILKNNSEIPVAEYAKYLKNWKAFDATLISNKSDSLFKKVETLKAIIKSQKRRI